MPEKGRRPWGPHKPQGQRGAESARRRRPKGKLLDRLQDIDRRWWYAAAALLVAAVLLGNQGLRRLVSGSLLQRSLSRERKALLREETELKKRLKAARSDDRALENAARKELGYLKEGEVEYRFPPPPPEDD